MVLVVTIDGLSDEDPIGLPRPHSTMQVHLHLLGHHAGHADIAVDGVVHARVHHHHVLPTVHGVRDLDRVFFGGLVRWVGLVLPVSAH